MFIVQQNLLSPVTDQAPYFSKVSEAWPVRMSGRPKHCFEFLRPRRKSVKHESELSEPGSFGKELEEFGKELERFENELEGFGSSKKGS